MLIFVDNVLKIISWVNSKGRMHLLTVEIMHSYVRRAKSGLSHPLELRMRTEQQSMSGLIHYSDASLGLMPGKFKPGMLPKDTSVLYLFPHPFGLAVQRGHDAPRVGSIEFLDSHARK